MLSESMYILLLLLLVRGRFDAPQIVGFFTYIYIGSEQKSVDNTNDAYRVSNFELRVG